MRKRRDNVPAERDVVAALPVRPSALIVMAALAEGPLPGFEILERANEGPSGHMLLGPGTLYRLMRDMRNEGLIERVAAPDEGGADERRQYHELTAFGVVVLRAEAARLSHTLRSAGLLLPAERGT